MARKRKEAKTKEKSYSAEPSSSSAVAEGVVLKDGNQDGLSVLVAVQEEVKVQQDHDANLTSIGFNGKLSIENPSSVDRLWDIDLTLKNIDSTDLESENIKVRELGTSNDNNTNNQDFQLTGDAKNLLLAKEYVNSIPDADDILNLKDIEADLLRIKENSTGAKAESFEITENKVVKDVLSDDVDDADEYLEEDEEKPKYDSWSIEELEEYCEDNMLDIPVGASKEEIISIIEDADKEQTDGGVAANEYNLEAFGVSINKSNEITFAIALHSLFEKSITDVKIVKDIPSKFNNVKIGYTSIGSANVEGSQLIWTIDELGPETTVILKFTADLYIDSHAAVKTGVIDISYKALSSFALFSVEKFGAFTRNKFYVDMVERDEEPGMWDCKLVFENPSEFFIELYDVDVHAPEDESKNYVSLPGDVFPKLPAGAEWHSDPWVYESDEYPSFRRKLDFRVLSDFNTNVASTISLEDVSLVLASITGTMSYNVPEIAGVEPEEGVMFVPSYKESEIEIILTLENNGSAPLNEITIAQQQFDDEFQPPKEEEVKVYVDGNEIQPDSIVIDDEGIKVILNNLKDKPSGMIEPNSKVEVKYPIHATNPPQDSAFESDVLYKANTSPIGPELEFIPVPEEIPVIKVIHIRRKYRVGKEIVPAGAIGKYQIFLHYQNVGDMPLKNFILLDKVPDNFEYSGFTTEPTDITDEVGTDTLKWVIDELEKGETLEITYDISGSGEYYASDAQLSF